MVIMTTLPIIIITVVVMRVGCVIATVKIGVMSPYHDVAVKIL